jgi:tripartite-type tricarboxylate transporter receptor subunit TctC
MTFKKLMRAVITLMVMAVAIFFIKKSTQNDASKASYPNRAIKIVVPFKPGGGSDRIARVVDEFTEKQFGRKFIFQYKEGGGGHLGMGFSAMAKADGYTIATYNTPDVALGPLTGAGNYSLDDFEFIGQIAFDPVVIVTNKTSKYSDLQDFLKAARENPGKLRMGISGAKGGTDLACRAMLESQGVDVKITQFASGSELASAVLGEQVHVGASGLTPFLGSIESIKVLATTGTQRHPRAPDGKTMAEQNIKMEIGVGRVFLVQKAVSKEKLEVLRARLKQIFDDSSFKEKMRKIGKEPVWEDGDTVRQKMNEFSVNAAAMIKKFYSK